MIRPTLLFLASAALVAAPASGQASRAELRTAQRLESLRHDGPRLYAFLRQMPKGADLHNHLGGAVYAESFLRWAVEDSACISTRDLSIINAPCATDSTTLRAARAVANPPQYDALIDAFSMRNWQPTRISGHEQFFGTFGRFAAAPYRTGDMLAEVASRAAAGRVSYLELMQTLDGNASRALGTEAGYRDDWTRLRDTLIRLGMDQAVQRARARLDSIEARRDTVLRCHAGTPDPGCGVTVRWIYQVLRAGRPEQVFAQILLGFRLAQVDPRVVGLNLVQPEDDRVAMRDYSMHMRMLHFLGLQYPDVPVTLHAGELVAGLVPPEGLRFHVREAVEVAGARRIGHGVSVMQEDRPDELLAEMVRRGVMVEINLTSNDGILGVRGTDHPLKSYLAAGVPVALSTDDEGVNRSEMTLEYLRAVLDQGLGYQVLKRMARTSLQYAFVGGASLWQDFSALKPVAACGGVMGRMTSARCAAFIAANTRARLQWQLEQDFSGFEGRMAAAR